MVARPFRSGEPRRRGGLPAAVAVALVLTLCTTAPGAGAGARAAAGAPAVGLRVLHLVDRTRSIRLRSGHGEPRVLLTYVRSPTAGGPYPLVVFGHGFAETPAPYAALLQAWARAGYVVAAPLFPLENADAPGGPNEADLVNQPADMRFVIARLLAASASGAGPLRGLIDPTRIAVAGHSDGGETALFTAYDPARPDARIRAAVLLSGARTPLRGFTFARPTAALLATQGTADTVNPPAVTDAFFRITPRPKFLLDLRGAGHLPPYTGEEPQLSVVEHTTIAFLDRYLKHGSLRRLLASGNVPGIATLVSEP